MPAYLVEKATERVRLLDEYVRAEALVASMRQVTGAWPPCSGGTVCSASTPALTRTSVKVRIVSSVRAKSSPRLSV